MLVEQVHLAESVEEEEWNGLHIRNPLQSLIVSTQSSPELDCQWMLLNGGFLCESQPRRRSFGSATRSSGGAALK